MLRARPSQNRTLLDFFHSFLSFPLPYKRNHLFPSMIQDFQTITDSNLSMPTDQANPDPMQDSIASTSNSQLSKEEIGRAALRSLGAPSSSTSGSSYPSSRIVPSTSPSSYSNFSNSTNSSSNSTNSYFFTSPRLQSDSPASSVFASPAPSPAFIPSSGHANLKQQQQQQQQQNNQHLQSRERASTSSSSPSSDQMNIDSTSTTSPPSWSHSSSPPSHTHQETALSKVAQEFNVSMDQARQVISPNQHSTTRELPESIRRSMRDSFESHEEVSSQLPTLEHI